MKKRLPPGLPDTSRRLNAGDPGALLFSARQKADELWRKFDHTGDREDMIRAGIASAAAWKIEQRTKPQTGTTPEGQTSE